MIKKNKITNRYLKLLDFIKTFANDCNVKYKIYIVYQNLYKLDNFKSNNLLDIEKFQRKMIVNRNPFNFESVYKITLQNLNENELDLEFELIKKKFIEIFITPNKNIFMFFPFMINFEHFLILTNNYNVVFKKYVDINAYNAILIFFSNLLLFDWLNIFEKASDSNFFRETFIFKLCLDKNYKNNNKIINTTKKFRLILQIEMNKFLVYLIFPFVSKTIYNVFLENILSINKKLNQYVFKQDNANDENRLSEIKKLFLNVNLFFAIKIYEQKEELIYNKRKLKLEKFKKLNPNFFKEKNIQGYYKKTKTHENLNFNIFKDNFRYFLYVNIAYKIFVNFFDFNLKKLTDRSLLTKILKWKKFNQKNIKYILCDSDSYLLTYENLNFQFFLCVKAFEIVDQMQFSLDFF